VTPDERFDELESRVRGRLMPVLPLRLRDRVLADVTRVAAPVPKLNWQLAAGLAAAVLVALNVAAIASSFFAGPVIPRTFPPYGESVASTESPTVAPRFGSPWLPCDLPGGR
jgi:hypothetical protein